jgi:cation-transporting P-type ATPase 13A2
LVFNELNLMASETTYRDITMFPLHTLAYPYPITSVFPAVVPTDQVIPASNLSSTSSLNKLNGGPDDNILERLLIVDYRYSRFALDPRTGLFSIVRLVEGSVCQHIV